MNYYSRLTKNLHTWNIIKISVLMSSCFRLVRNNKLNVPRNNNNKKKSSILIELYLI